MGPQWFYGRGSDISGPVSGSELAELAAAGKVLPSDTVWREGRESGVPAAKVKYLFTAPVHEPLASPAAVPETDAALVAPTSAEPAADDAHLAATPATGEPGSAESAPRAPSAPQQVPTRSARATAGKGAVIIGQDGKTVKFRMKCVTCGKEDSSWKSIPIPRSLHRVSFFCPKCRKRQEVEIFGIH